MYNKIKTFVISVKEYNLRRSYIVDECDKLGLNYKIFDAINGSNLGLVPLNFNKLEYPDSNCRISLGGVGCALSHYMLWNLIQYLPEEEFFILEDDCIFSSNFKDKFNELYYKLPLDWNMVYVGWIKYGKELYKRDVTDGISVRTPSATHAYLIKKSAIPILINSLHPISSPIDLHLIEKALPRLNYYVFEPSLVEQKSYMNHSDFNWLSSGYNWDMDTWNIKRKICSNFKFINGVYNVERNGNEEWIWSYPEFELLYNSIGDVHITYSSVISNELVMFNGEKEEIIDIYPGDNLLIINSNTNFGVNVKVKLKNEFIPSQENKLSFDDRKLGICIKNISIKINDIEIKLDLSSID